MSSNTEKISSNDRKNIQFYETLLAKYDHTYKVLNWGSEDSQKARFKVLSEIGIQKGDSLLDVGCGLADLYSWLESNIGQIDYHGIDITPGMIASSKKRFPFLPLNVGTIFDFDINKSHFDYVFACGIFYLNENEPAKYLQATVERMFAISKKGIAFNCLSSWRIDQSEGEFYADPALTLEFCRMLTTKIVLRHDYHPGDFTIYMMK